MIKFGTDGWRAVIGDDYTFENVKKLTQAVADYLKRQRGERVVVGYDRRFLSEEFAKASACVFAANNIKVILSSHDVPTPVISFACLYGKYDLGVMITASHNPAKFNGYKIKTKEGGSADKNLTDEIEKLIGRSKVKDLDFNEAKAKSFIRLEDLALSYMRFFRKYVDLAKIRKLKLKVLVDTMYGAGNGYIEKILGRCSIKIDYLHNDDNPGFKGTNPEPIAPNLGELIAKVKNGGYDMGVCLDGDADRVAFVDGRGNFIDAQVILPLLALHMIKNRKCGGGIGKTVVGSNTIDAVALDLGVSCYETPVGFKYISNLFKDGLIAIGGEEAGGIGYSGYIPERDGSMSFLLVLEMIAYHKSNFNRLLANLYKKYGRRFYTRTAVSVRRSGKNINDMKLPDNLAGKPIERINKLDGIKLIARDSWLMLRASGTEPIIRIYAESQSRSESNRLIELGKKMIYGL